jgi:hypothetical protein
MPLLNLVDRFPKTCIRFSPSTPKFIDKGDSGALVWTDEEIAVEIIIAGWTSAFENPPLKAVILPNQHRDTQNNRYKDGSIDFTGLLSFSVYRPFNLVESFKMAIDDVGSRCKL